MSLSYESRIIFTELIDSFSKLFVFRIIMLLSLMSVIYIFSVNLVKISIWFSNITEQKNSVSYKKVNLNMIRTLKMTKMTSWNSFIAHRFSIINCWKLTGK